MTVPITIRPPNGLTARPLSMNDVASVTELLAAWERAEPVDQSYSETDIREEFAAPDAALDGGGVAVLDGDRVVAYGLLHVIAREPEWVAFADGGVHPEMHRRGIGRWILDRQIEQARQLTAGQSPGRPGELRVGVGETRLGTQAALFAAGFATERYFFRMRADLRGPAPAETDDPTGVRIRPYAATDDEALRLVSNASFADHWGSVPRDADTWRSEYSDAAAFRPAASFVAVQAGGSIVGFALAAEHDADTARRGYRTGYVARVATARAARGRGIGTALVSRSMAAMRMQGCAAADLHVDAASPTGAGRLYERLGFGVVDRDRLLTRKL